jgi:hypothetical protein
VPSPFLPEVVELVVVVWELDLFRRSFGMEALPERELTVSHEYELIPGKPVRKEGSVDLEPKSNTRMTYPYPCLSYLGTSSYLNGGLLLQGTTYILLRARVELVTYLLNYGGEGLAGLDLFLC